MKLSVFLKNYKKNLFNLFSKVGKIFNNIIILLILFYKKAISVHLYPSCKFVPSCSTYAYEAFKKYNFFKASFLTIKRIIRCNPFNKGGYDPLP